MNYTEQDIYADAATVLRDPEQCNFDPSPDKLLRLLTDVVASVKTDEDARQATLFAMRLKTCYSVVLMDSVCSVHHAVIASDEFEAWRGKFAQYVREVL